VPFFRAPTLVQPVAPPEPEVAAPDRIGDTDRVSRFLFDEKRIRHGDLVKWQDLRPPNKGEHTHETSVSRCHAMIEDDVWRYGDEYATRPDGKSPLGRADFPAGAVAQAQLPGFVLRLEISEPPPKHANILGWPDLSQKEVRDQLAMELRDKAGRSSSTATILPHKLHGQGFFAPSLLPLSSGQRNSDHRNCSAIASATAVIVAGFESIRRCHRRCQPRGEGFDSYATLGFDCVA
jgi:hypothetical protein